MRKSSTVPEGSPSTGRRYSRNGSSSAMAERPSVFAPKPTFSPIFSFLQTDLYFIMRAQDTARTTQSPTYGFP